MSTDFALSGEQSWRILRLYHLYRLVIGLTLALLVSSDLDTELLEMAHPTLFRNGSWLYLALNVLIIATVRRPKRLAQIFSLALVDVILLSGLFYAAGGTPSGIGNLLIVAVAIANILLRGRIGLLIAAVAAWNSAAAGTPWSQLQSWLRFMPAVLSGLIAAWLCRRHQASLGHQTGPGHPHRMLWITFVVLFGVFGYIGYRYHRRWPVWDSEFDSVNGFAPPAMTGIEVIG